MIPQQDWPSMPEFKPDDTQNIIDLKKMLYKAKLDFFIAQQAAATEQETTDNADVCERQKAAYANEYALGQSVHNAYIEIAKSQALGTSGKSDFVQKAAAAISVAYVAVLGLSYGVAGVYAPLPLQGILPTIFLGISIFLSTAYTAYITEPEPIKEPDTGGSEAGILYTFQVTRRNTFIRWAESIMLNRKYLLQVAVISLGFAVAYLPASYLDINEVDFNFLIIIGLACSFILPLIFRIPIWIKNKKTPDTETDIQESDQSFPEKNLSKTG